MNTQNEELIMSLIKLAGGKSDVVDDTTPLMMLIDGKMENEALALIATGKSQPEYVNKRKRTALWCAINHSLEKVALALIAIGKTELFQPDVYGMTPLMEVCSDKKQVKVALALIATGKSEPALVETDGSTALIYACYFSVETVALALLDTGKSNYQQIDRNGNNALYYAKHNCLTKVIEKIESMMKPVSQISSTPTSSIQTSSTLKCFICTKNLDKKTHIIEPCGHSEFHSDCLIFRLMLDRNPCKTCPVCMRIINAVKLP